MSKTDPVGEQRVSDERIERIAYYEDLPTTLEASQMAIELQTLRTQSAAVAEEKPKCCVCDRDDCPSPLLYRKKNPPTFARFKNDPAADVEEEKQS